MLRCKQRIVAKVAIVWTRTRGTGTYASTSDLKITSVEAIYLRLAEVKTQCDSGQDALIVKVATDAGDHRVWRSRFEPDGGEGVHRGPVFAHDGDRSGHVLIGEDPFRTEYLGTRCTGQHLRQTARGRRSTP